MRALKCGLIPPFSELLVPVADLNPYQGKGLTRCPPHSATFTGDTASHSLSANRLRLVPDWFGLDFEFNTKLCINISEWQSSTIHTIRKLSLQAHFLET